MCHSAINLGYTAQAHGKTGGEAQEWVRAMLGTVGRGGNAQVRSLPTYFLILVDTQQDKACASTPC